LKLFDKYNRLNIAATIATFIIGSCVFYFTLNYILIDQLDETLQSEQQEVISYVKVHNELQDITPSKEEYISYTLSNNNIPTRFVYSKRKIDLEEENLREIQFVITANGKSYQVNIAKPLEETEALLKVIIGVTVAMIAIILLVGYLINRVVIRRLWKPFYRTIDQVKQYQLSGKNTLHLETVGIDEFALLNKSINEMVERIQQDYLSLKDFTGQAAHEMQTPLAIISGKLDLLMQNEALLEKSAQHIADIEKAVYRLSRLHQSLLLLTKVENKQFILNEEVSLDTVIKDKSREYAEMAGTSQLKISLNLQPTTILFHKHLAEIIVSNLFNNAIRYNIAGGDVEITLKDLNLTISNSSPYPELDYNKLFKRFYRGAHSEDGSGLGLSIVKQVCDMVGYSIKYQYVNDRHDFTITLKPIL
jgi:signal transduction histidine kinase